MSAGVLAPDVQPVGRVGGRYAVVICESEIRITDESERRTTRTDGSSVS